MFSKGVFLHSIIKDKKDWKKQADFINLLSGIDHVELMIEEGLTLPDLKLVKYLFGKHTIIIHAPFADLTLTSLHPEIREATLKIY